MAIVTISRQLGSFGDKIAQGLADELKYQLLSREQILKMLQESGYAGEQGIDHVSAERIPSLLSSFTTDRDRFLCYITKAMYQFAQQSNVIIMDMGTQLLFRDLQDTLRVRIVAPQDTRIKRIQAEQDCHERYAQNQMEESDRARSGFNKYFFDIDWESLNLYNMVLSTGVISQQGAIRMLTAAIQDIETAVSREVVKKKLQALVLKQNILIRILYEEKLVFQYFNVDVHEGGLVTLSGFSKTEKEEDRARCEAAVRNVVGVTDVVNKLIVEPSSFA